MSTYNISKSSLLSLKAEVIRKQEEVKKAKLQNQFKRVHEPKKLTPLEVKNKGVEDREIQDSQEDEGVLEKSRKILERKAQIYENICNSTKKLSSEENEHIQRFLVHFDKKKAKQHEEDYEESVYDPPQNPEEEWVEYIDCLGRTRTCMKKDLEYLKSKDAELRASVENDVNKVEQLANIDNNIKITNDKEKCFDENSELLSSDMRREILRKEWEKEEAELAKKENVHYQDVLFNEARTHGVGYYAFSKDESERARQQDELKKLRKETEEEQKKAQQLKIQRDKQLAARIKAAKNRKRARLGLPPEDDDTDEEVVTLNTNKEKEEEEIKMKQLELEKEEILKAKEAHLRPWDIGKEGVKEHYVYSQEEWVQKKRKERPREFAPPQNLYNRSNFRSVGDTNLKLGEDENKKLYFSSKKEKLHRNSEQKEKHDDNDEKDTFTKKKVFSNSDKFRSKEDIFQKTLIIDELDGSNISRNTDDEGIDYCSRGRSVEIPPPATFEYYESSNCPKKPKYRENINMEESISAGLRFLRNKIETKK